MLGLINNIYILATIILYITLSIKITANYPLVIFFTIFTSIIYYKTLSINSNLQDKFYNRRYLRIEVFLYVLFFMVIQNSISYIYNDNFYMFSFSDAYLYHRLTLEILDMSYIEGIKHYLSFMDVDDLGIILVLYPLYKIYVSNLMLNLLYLFISVISAVSIFGLSSNFMTKKYAFLSSLSYSISSFVLFFNSTGLKESLMVMFVLLAFEFYYKFIYTKNSLYLISSFIFLGTLFLFRPAIAMMIVAGIVITSLVTREGNLTIKVGSILILLGAVAMIGTIITMVNIYTTGGVDTLIEARESQGMVIGGVGFTYAVNILSQTIGPIPTLISDSKVSTMFYASGLIYRMLLAIPFWLGVFYIFKKGFTSLYPISLFIIFEMSALTFLMDGLELRKAISHIPFIFIVAFWFLDKYDRDLIKIKRKRLFKEFFYTSVISLIFIIYYWNNR